MHDHFHGMLSRLSRLGSHHDAIGAAPDRRNIAITSSLAKMPLACLQLSMDHVILDPELRFKFLTCGSFSPNQFSNDI